MLVMVGVFWRFMEPIQFRIAEKVLKKIDEEVAGGLYLTRSDFIRDAIRVSLTKKRRK